VNRLPVLARADLCVVGAGAAGCVLAGRLTEEHGRTVCLVEAGPDYGSHDAGRWPADLLDASDCATSHDWGYGVDVACRVVGGCSAHNGCLVVHGTPGDYDGWAAATGDAGWGWTAMEPLLHRAEQTIATRRYPPQEVGSFTRATLAAWAGLGEPVLDDFNAVDAIRGAGLTPVNRRGATRWSAAFAYLDPARDRSGLTVLADALADRVVVEGGRARGVVVHTPAGAGLVEAETVVLAAGAYGSPPVLLRSGIGPADALRALGIDVVADLPGVGRELADHPCVHVRLTASDELAAMLADDDARGILTHVQAKLKAASSHCPAGTFDLHVLPNVGWERDADGRRTGRHELSLIPVLLEPRGHGSVTLRSADPHDVPVIDQGLFRDPESVDLAIVGEGIELARAVAAAEPLRSLLTGDAVADPLPDEGWTLFHPVGTCRMGRPGAPDTVVDPDGRVLGVDGLRVADASVFPTVPRANTHLSALAVAEAMAERLQG
jgi:choline dehydrogenase